MNRILWLAISWICVAGCVSHAPKQTDAQLQRFEFQKPEMGLPFRIVLYAPDEKKANEAAAAAFQRIGQLNDIMSDYDEESELTLLSKTAGQGKAVKVSDDLWRVLDRAQQLAKESDGAFDITVGPVVQLWRKARREQKLPDRENLAIARAAVGFKNLQLDQKLHTAELLVSRMKLDLGAIAKGYANDEAMKVLRSHGVTRALVTGGGDMAAGDPPPGKKGWRIELAPLDVPNAPPTNFVMIANQGLATSGDLFQHVEIDGTRYSHIVDPRTGIGLTDHSLVVVIARDGMTADGLSTTLSVIGGEKGRRIVEGHHAEARMVRNVSDRVEIFETVGFKKYLQDK
ncbi:MAG: FAD:protein transferase [Verrucomicrobiales bacterium]|nr:FAD:protein transferase [Verrucomicrobiales bacterium]